MKRLISIILSTVYLVGAFGENISLKKDFSVQPGGRTYSTTIERDGISCTFTYQCQGGTNEKWHMMLSKIRDDNGYGCVVERSGSKTSYIFFQSFKLEVKPSVEALAASAFGNNDQPLLLEEYTFDKNQRSGDSVSHICRIWKE
ncbi:unnamed protein product [Heterobilharzia americana]|nr:unnamed protein product [Heterobilharzia americana]CAH8456018.1 unnamed protein product [Heterobilharzia americana]